MAAFVLAHAGCTGSGGHSGSGDRSPRNIAAPDNLTFATNPATYIVGLAIAGNRPTSGGGAVSSYSVSPDLPSGLHLDPSTGIISGTPTAFAPQAMYAVTATNAGGSTGVSLSIAVHETGVLAKGLSFLPASQNSAIQLRASLAATATDLYFSDSSDAPLKRLSLVDGTVSDLAFWSGPPQRITVDGTSVVWTDGWSLLRTALADGTTARLATGNLYVSPAILTDGAGVYWVRATSQSTYQIERVEPAGTVVLAYVTTQSVSGLAQDATSIYWEEDSPEAMFPGSTGGSKIQKVSKSGSEPVALVDGWLNGLIPTTAPGGYVPGSWVPAGGIATDGSNVVFSDQADILAVPTSGGPVAVLASIAMSAPEIPQQLAIDDAGVYWIDATQAHALATGGSATTLASGLLAPSGITASGGSVFISEAGTIGECCRLAGTGRIEQVPTAGGAPTIVADSLDSPAAVAVGGSTVYWGEPWRVASAPASGGAPSTLAAFIRNSLPQVIVSGGHLLVLDGEYVKTLPLAGGTLDKVAVTDHLEDLASITGDVAADAAAVYLYNAGIGLGDPTPASVVRISLDGSPRSTFAVPGIAAPQDCVQRVAVDAQNVYWSTGSLSSPLGCAIHAAPIAGGAVVTLVDGLIRDFAVADGQVYFSAGQGVVIDGTGTHLVGEESINVVPSAGGPITTWPAPPNDYPSVIALDDTEVYWIGLEGALRCMPRNGGASLLIDLEPFDEAPNTFDTIAPSGGNLFWTDMNTGWIGVMRSN
jgi:hypothetical protein